MSNTFKVILKVMTFISIVTIFNMLFSLNIVFADPYGGQGFADYDDKTAAQESNNEIVEQKKQENISQNEEKTSNTKDNTNSKENIMNENTNGNIYKNAEINNLKTYNTNNNMENTTSNVTEMKRSISITKVIIIIIVILLVLIVIMGIINSKKSKH